MPSSDAADAAAAGAADPVLSGVVTANPALPAARRAPVLGTDGDPTRPTLTIQRTSSTRLLLPNPA
jgi:hypothetical protein